MKANAPTLSQVVTMDRSWIAVFADLFKARLTLLVLLTTTVGFYAGWSGAADWALLAHTLFGTGLVACGGAALNQWLEREYDARMRRTQDRPLPGGYLQPATACTIGWTCGIAGLAELAFFVNVLTAALGLFTFVTYVLVYTPLKRVTWLNTFVGAIPGAMPPLLGWTAATGEIGLMGLVLFSIQALWQIPHFFAIAWLYRGEYAKAGFKMLPVEDASGVRTSRHALWHTAVLAAVSLVPVTLQAAGPVYLVTSVVLGAGFAWYAVKFARELSQPSARKLFYASLVYLPVLLSALVLDNLKGF